MKHVLLAALTLLALNVAAFAQEPLVIKKDYGGRIGTYVDRAQELRSSDKHVQIDGPCVSACTIIVAAMPLDRICVTGHAVLGFHAASDFDANGKSITDPEATQKLYSMYSKPMRAWIRKRGGLTPHVIFLRGRELQQMIPPCKPVRFAHN